jgi:DNA mismatch repair protein MutS
MGEGKWRQSSPMLEQYRRIKREHQGEVLFFRLGDFYEMFAEDAIEVSALLNLVLTSRNGLPMCGIPHHAYRSYIARLLKHGKKVAICEQLSGPDKGQKVIERQVVEIITPGTTIDEDFLDKSNSNYLAGLAGNASFVSFAYIDLSTGDFHATAFPRSGSQDRLRQELERLEVRELLIQESLLEEDSGIARAVLDRGGIVLNRWADWLFDQGRAKQRLETQFGLSNLKGFGLDEGSGELLAAGALLDYLDGTAKSLLPHVRTITVYHDGEYVGIDEASQRNLELVRNLRDGDSRFSLLEVMDETRTAMGRRLLKRRILHPLRDVHRIQSRLDMVETLYRDQGNLSILRELLGKTPDLERLCSRLAMDRAHGKDMLSIKNALAGSEGIKQLRDTLGLRFETGGRQDGGDGFSRLMDLKELLGRGICDEPSILLTEGNLIREGYSAELDALRTLHDSGRQMLETYLEEEKLATGITNLKIRYNRLIGYFLEVTNAHLARVPAHFIRRQGIAGGERFSTERLAALESDINGASDKIIELERTLFLEIREQAKRLIGDLLDEARRIAEIDAAQSLAKAAAIHGWTRPQLDNSTALAIYEGRHPVVEAHLARGEYIPNDILLNDFSQDAESGGVSFAMITGPNMAGKSTYLRSAALIVLMSQMGSFVPAREARIGLCDRIYCRVGASDNLARGESTFLVEMNETAYILHTATEQSLVIMDEVGRGTGTNDGLSIAWAVSEELLNRIKCRTLFATHYHELALIVHPRMANRSMEVLDRNGEIIFLRKLREGPASESYGIHVARLAGLARPVLERAAHIMERLRERDANLRDALPLGGGARGDAAAYGETESDAGEVFSAKSGGGAPAKTRDDFSGGERAVLRELQSLDPNQLTPLDALSLLNRLKEQLGCGEDAGDFPRKACPARAKPRRGQEAEDAGPTLFDSEPE